MTTKYPDGGPAFPLQTQAYVNNGMTLLDHFAGLAMQAMIIARSAAQTLDDDPEELGAFCDGAYDYAAAMLHAKANAGPR